MKIVKREELVDFQTYRDSRDATRAKVLQVKAARRIHVGQYLTFLFENPETVKYQVQEMMLAERMVREVDIQHELDTYNELLGGPGELGATLLVEIEDAKERDDKLKRWLELPAHLYAKLDDGKKVYARFDERQVSDGRLSSVHYLKLDVLGRTPVAIGCDYADLSGETVLTPAQHQALEEDLKQTR
jgi:Protein of unknown function (DUF3501)